MSKKTKVEHILCRSILSILKHYVKVVHVALLYSCKVISGTIEVISGHIFVTSGIFGSVMHICE